MLSGNYAREQLEALNKGFRLRPRIVEVTNGDRVEFFAMHYSEREELSTAFLTRLRKIVASPSFVNNYAFNLGNHPKTRGAYIEIARAGSPEARAIMAERAQSLKRLL